MNANKQSKQTTSDHNSDPLGLRKLDSVEPGYDGWAGIESALKAHQDSKRNWRRAGGWLAVAASLVLVMGIIMQTNQSQLSPDMNPAGFATPTDNLASVSVQDNISALIGLSQKMEQQVKRLRQETGSMPAESAIYVAELEDLIAQVDSELSQTPESIDLWGQRVNLMLDLAQIYQQRWEIDYGRMASL